MKGTNVMQLNHETMCEAIQLWLADKFKVPPTVITVDKSEESSGRYGSAGGGAIFKVVVVVPEPAEGEAT